MSRRELRARVELLEAELQRERALRRPTVHDELVLLRREVGDLQALVHLHPEKLKVYRELKSSLAEDARRRKQLRRRLQRELHPDKSKAYANVTAVLTRLSALINEELADG